MSSDARYRKGEEVTTFRMAPSMEERSFMNFLWNSKKKAIMGRTVCSWGKIGLFYIVFYICLAVVFSAFMHIFMLTIDYEVPKYIGQDSLLQNPGLGFRPLLRYTDELRPTIYYHSRYNEFTDSLNLFMMPYRDDSDFPSRIHCFPGHDYPIEGGVCQFDVDKINSSCSYDNGWGYDSNSPCILLKLNKVFGWVPEPYDHVDDLPEGLQHYIHNTDNPYETLRQNVWIWCESEDVELEQTSPAIPLHFFPYQNQLGYLSPFVLVRLLNLTEYEKVKVDCRVWARDVKHKIKRAKIAETTIYVELGG